MRFIAWAFALNCWAFNYSEPLTYDDPLDPSFSSLSSTQMKRNETVAQMKTFKSTKN